MKTSRFTEEQIAFAVKQAQLGTKVEEICRKMSISDATLYTPTEFALQAGLKASPQSNQTAGNSNL